MAIKCVAGLGNEPEWANDGGGGPPKESRTGGDRGGFGGAGSRRGGHSATHYASRISARTSVVNLAKR